MESNLPALQVAIPLLAAPLAILVRRGGLAWAVTWIAALASLACALALLSRAAHGPVRYFMGSWPPPWGIEYRVDLASALLLALVAAVAWVVATFARTSVQREVPPDRQALFYAAFLLALTGLLGIVVTGDAFNLFVFLEISSLASYILVASGNDRRALTASYQYLVLGTIGATFILIGIGFMYMATGSLNMVDLAQRLPQASAQRTVSVAFIFFTVGASLKLALFPLHLWLPNAYTYAPSVASALLAATATKVAIYVLLRFWLTVFGHAYAFGGMPLFEVMGSLAVIGIFSASVSAIFQQNAKRLLAYSSVAQVGYIVLGISLGTVSGVAAGLLHLFNHALMKGALFLALGCVFYRLGSVRLDAMRGIGRQMPWTMAAFVVGGMSLVGVPLTSGFISKLQLVGSLLEVGHWPLAVYAVATSLLAAAYVWKVVETAYFRAPLTEERVREAPLGLLLPTWGLALANIYFGIDTRFSWGTAREAAGVLLAGVAR